ncbi:MAG: hypothetical protein DYG93_09325 [Leptolyngbya sp. PLA2]|nr:hypothetical protein [Leptolyngbya sp.]MCE7971848.1 hypothetical protein [Leptolyngbya sp. PL-A2]MCZ7634489.1 hypothetical protein [Phycisphaerales bacterium]MDL1904713.1 hypothetical protein [Synechococcales cyanobacterium CNB]GIK19805.1 MAG: hypothetical protein BroJett004_19690 [Planctomycetota bacterium]
MNPLRYTDIGHSTDAGRVEAWWIGEQGRLRTHGCRAGQLRRHGEDRPIRAASRLRALAIGRVELDRSVGSVHLPQTASDDDLTMTLDRLERRYPGVRWFVFGEAGARECARASA